MQVITGIVDCRPEEVGYDSSRLEVLNRHLQRQIDENKIQCASYCIAKNGKVIGHAAMGPSHFEKSDILLQPDTISPIASITKVFTTTAIMQLVEDGYIRLDSRIGDILPQFSTVPFDKITIFHLLTHTSGLHPDQGCYENKYFIPPWGFIDKLSEGCEDLANYDWIAAGLHAGMKAEPGERWMYCSFGFAVLGEVIKKVTGIHAHDYIVDKIAKPLGLKDTGFVATPEVAKRAIVRSKDEKEMVEKILAVGKVVNYAEGTIWEHVPETGGGLHSTIYDLVRFGNMMLGNGRLDGVRILGRKAVEKVTTRAIHNVPDTCWGSECKDRGYGVGWDMRFGPGFVCSDGSYIHEGAGACTLYVDPKEQLTAAWFVPFVDGKWYAEPLYNVQNVICSGVI